MGMITFAPREVPPPLLCVWDATLQTTSSNLVPQVRDMFELEQQAHIPRFFFPPPLCLCLSLSNSVSVTHTLSLLYTFSLSHIFYLSFSLSPSLSLSVSLRSMEKQLRLSPRPHSHSILSLQSIPLKFTTH